MNPVLRLLAALCLLLVCPSISLAWSYKEHIQLTRIAVARLLADPTTPEPMKAWLRQAVPGAHDMAAERQFFMTGRVGTKPTGYEGMLYWSYMPDEHALNDKGTAKVAPFGVHEKLLHYIDLELFKPGDQKRGYRHDLSGRPEIEQVPRNMTDARYVQAGMLPFRIEQIYRSLVDHIRAGKLHAPTAQDQEGKTATYFAGYLAHYLADNTQPHHATLDYKSQSYFADRRKAPNIHSEVEYRMIDDENNDYRALREEFWPLFVAALEAQHPQVSRDPWRGSLEVSYISYDALPLIGSAAMHGAKQAGTPDKPTGPAAPVFDTEAFFRFKGAYRGRKMSVMEMKALQTAWAVRRIEQVLRQAWDEAVAVK